jgi:hypothetical protein
VLVAGTARPPACPAGAGGRRGGPDRVRPGPGVVGTPGRHRPEPAGHATAGRDAGGDGHAASAGRHRTGRPDHRTRPGAGRCRAAPAPGPCTAGRRDHGRRPPCRGGGGPAGLRAHGGRSGRGLAPGTCGQRRRLAR